MGAGLLPTNFKDFEDRYTDILVLEQSDMTVSDTQKITTKYVDESGNKVWLEYEIGLNSSGETLYFKKLSESYEKPSWVPNPIITE